MITIRTGAYSDKDVAFLIDVLVDGLRKTCYLFNSDVMVFNPLNVANYECTECKQKIACKEAQSALHHLISVYCREQTKNLK